MQGGESCLPKHLVFLHMPQFFFFFALYTKKICEECGIVHILAPKAIFLCDMIVTYTRRVVFFFFFFLAFVDRFALTCS